MERTPLEVAKEELPLQLVLSTLKNSTMILEKAKELMRTEEQLSVAKGREANPEMLTH
jgi:hypothetical protein